MISTVDACTKLPGVRIDSSPVIMLQGMPAAVILS